MNGQVNRAMVDMEGSYTVIYNAMQLIHSVQAGPIAEAPRLSDILLSVLHFVVAIVGVIAVLVIVVAGIMYMTSGGDEGRVAMAKKALVGGVIGVVIIVLSLTIVHVLIDLV